MAEKPCHPRPPRGKGKGAALPPLTRRPCPVPVGAAAGLGLRQEDSAKRGRHEMEAAK
jgi:hypothetical protein